MIPLLVVGLGLAGGLACVAGAIALRRRASDRRLGALVAIDAGRPWTLRSERYRLAGRPDALRRQADGRLVPIELKHRSLPPRGPYPSHLVQLGAYCLLVEETTGVAPPFGVLRYRDGEVEVRFDASLRRTVLTALAAASAAYDGSADPSPAKCGGCPWSPRCDLSQAPGR